MHLSHPRRRDFWTWEELGYLAKTLGFQQDLFSKYFPKDELEEKRGLKIKEIGDLFDSKALSPDLHRTFNMHDAAYNLKVIQKAMILLSSKSLSFHQIKEARLAFQLYEHMDNAGLVINEHVIRRTLKMCGRAISSIKLMQYIKHMDKLVADRLMFYEFLEILLISEKVLDVTNTQESKDKRKSKSKDNRDLFELCDFHDILITEDEKMSKQLNELHQRDLQKIPVRKLQKDEDLKEKKPWLVPPIVDHEKREKLVKKNKEQKEVLKQQMDISNGQVLLKSSFPSCDCNQPELQAALVHNMHLEEKPKNEDDIPYSNDPYKNASEVLVYRQDAVVTDKEMNSTSVAIEELKWQLATQGERMRQIREMSSGKKRIFKTHREDTPEPEEKPKEVVEDKVRQNTSHSLTDLIRNESPELARKLDARLKDASSTKKEVEKPQIIDRSGKNLQQLEKPEREEKKITLEERLRNIDRKLDAVIPR